MIQYNVKTGDWEFHTLEAMYTDGSSGEPVVRTEYITNRRYLEERVRQWPHLSGLVIHDLEPSMDQKARLSDINAANVEQEHELYVTEYVRYGYITPPTVEEGETIDLGHTYLNTLVNRAENAQRKLTADRLKLSDEVANQRWKKEISGITVNSMYFGTTDREKALLASKVLAAMNKPGATHKYKTAQGWITVTSEIMIQLGLAVEQYVQSCFDREGELVDLINTTEDLSTIDITAGWPNWEFTLDFSGE